MVLCGENGTKISSYYYYYYYLYCNYSYFILIFIIKNKLNCWNFATSDVVCTYRQQWFGK